jgi:hypothetical protein
VKIKMIHAVIDILSVTPSAWQCQRVSCDQRYEKEHRKKPRFEGQVRIVKNRLSRNTEFVVALGTLKLFLCGDLKYITAFTAQTLNPERPAKPLQKLTTTVIRTEHPINVDQGHDQKPPRNKTR